MLEVGENFVVLNMVQNVPANNVFKKFKGEIPKLLFFLSLDVPVKRFSGFFLITSL